MAKVNFAELNSTIRYVMYSVFTIDYKSLYPDRDKLIEQAEQFFEDLDPSIVVRGFYDISGLRADADYLIWWHAPTIELLQSAYKDWIHKTYAGQASTPVWSNVGLHRPAEFNKSHIPAFLRDEPPGKYLCVYPFIRSYDWYIIPEEERRSLLAEHGRLARDFPEVRANTISSFALGDYEWILAFESPELHLIVDLMRHLRNSETRLHVRLETPFFTGPKVTLSELFSQ